MMTWIFKLIPKKLKSEMGRIKIINTFVNVFYYLM